MKKKGDETAATETEGEGAAGGGEEGAAGDIETGEDNDSVGKETEGSTDNDEQLGDKPKGEEVDGGEEDEDSDASSVVSDVDEEFEVAENEVRMDKNRNSVHKSQYSFRHIHQPLSLLVVDCVDLPGLPLLHF